MILVFDMDDTLYPEIEFVHNGFRNVAKFISTTFAVAENDVFTRLCETLEHAGRGQIFNLVLREIGHESAKNVKACVGAYRYGGTQIQLPKRIEKMLAELSRERNLYLVTDGNKIVQRLKVESLGLDRFFVGIFITHRFGKDKAKPSLYCFDKIAAREGASLSDIIYVADDPHKDFVKLNKAGATTIRVCTGRFRTTKAAAGYDARITIDSLDDLRQALLPLERNESA